MNPRRSVWMLACAGLLSVGGLLGFQVYRLEARLASLEAGSAPRPASSSPAATAPSAEVTAQPVKPLGRTLRLDPDAAREVARGLGGRLGLESERVERLARFLMAFHLRAALASARAEGGDVSVAEASHAELLKGDLKQQLLELRLSEAQLGTLARETPGLEAVLSR